MVLTEMAPAGAPRLCECDCGGELKDKRGRSRFLPGHHMYVYGHRWPTCRRCGRKASRPGKRLDSYDAQTNTYLCKWCRRQEVRCRRCGKVAELTPQRIANLKTLRTEADGSLTYLCRECQARDRSRIARAALLKQHYDIGPGDAAAREAWKDHIEAVVRTVGGRQNLRNMREGSRGRGLMTEKGRRKLTIKKMIAAQRAGEFRLCPLPSCQKLIYLSPFRVRDGALGFHRECYREYMNSDSYKDWRENLGDLRSPTLSLRLRRFAHPSPPRQRGNPPTSEQLKNHFRWLLRHYLLHQSWRGIQAIEGTYSHSAISEGVKSLIAMLPDSWSQVFCGHITGQRLDKLLPIGRLKKLHKQ